MGPKPATHCKQCGTPRNDSFAGKVCRPCRLINMAQYNLDHKEHINKKNSELRINRKLEIDPNYTPKVYRTKEEIKQAKKDNSKSYYERHREAINQKANFVYKFRKLKESGVFCRKPLHSKRDFETYTNNKTWSVDHNMHINFDILRTIPLDRLDVAYYDALEEQRKHNAINAGYGEQIVPEPSDYTKKDKEYGRYLDKNGDEKIRFYPT